MIDIPIKQLEILKSILRSFLTKEQNVYIYGSRAKKTNTKFSDIDLLIVGEPLTQTDLSKLKEAFSESDLPYFVDINNKKDLDKEFYTLIEKDMKQIEIEIQN